MTILDGHNVVGDNENFVFGVRADAIFVDAGVVTFHSGISSVSNNQHAGGESIAFNNTQIEADPFNAAMPFAGKVIGYWWQLNTMGGFGGTYTFHVLVNGVRVESDVLVVDSAGLKISNPISVPFNAGDRVEIERVRSANSTTKQEGAFCMAVSWD